MALKKVIVNTGFLGVKIQIAIAYWSTHAFDIQENLAIKFFNNIIK